MDLHFAPNNDQLKVRARMRARDESSRGWSADRRFTGERVSPFSGGDDAVATALVAEQLGDLDQA